MVSRQIAVRRLFVCVSLLFLAHNETTPSGARLSYFGTTANAQRSSDNYPLCSGIRRDTKRLIHHLLVFFFNSFCSNGGSDNVSSEIGQ